MGRKSKKFKVVWEQVPDPQAEERVLQAFELLIGPEIREGVPKPAGKLAPSRQPGLFEEDEPKR